MFIMLKFCRKYIFALEYCKRLIALYVIEKLFIVIIFIHSLLCIYAPTYIRSV